MTVRVQFDIADDQWEDMQRLMARCGMDTRKELFNNAYALLKWVVNQRAAGRYIAAVSDETKTMKELEMHFFEKLDRERGQEERIPTPSHR